MERSSYSLSTATWNKRITKKYKLYKCLAVYIPTKTQRNSDILNTYEHCFHSTEQTPHCMIPGSNSWQLRASVRRWPVTRAAAHIGLLEANVFKLNQFTVCEGSFDWLNQFSATTCRVPSRFVVFRPYLIYPFSLAIKCNFRSLIDNKNRRSNGVSYHQTYLLINIRRR